MAGQTRNRSGARRAEVGTIAGEFPVVALRVAPEPAWVDPVIAFANDDLAAKGAIRRWVRFIARQYEADWKQWKAIERPLEDQARLRTLLDWMISGRRASRLRQEVARSVNVVGVEGSGGFDSREGFVGTVHLTFSSTEKWYAIALAALLDAGLEDRVQRCADRTCRKLFVDWPRSGPRREYCCVQHQDRTRKRESRR